MDLKSNLVSFTKEMKTDKLRREEDEKEWVKKYNILCNRQRREEQRKGKRDAAQQDLGKPHLLTMIAASVYRPN
jgi:hypothetical protein